MSGFGVVGPESQSHLDWCRNLWASMNDEAVWAVPRSGIVLQKDEKNLRLVVVEAMPWDPEMPISQDDFLRQQDEEVEGVRQRFASIGIEVSW